MSDTATMIDGNAAANAPATMDPGTAPVPSSQAASLPETPAGANSSDEAANTPRIDPVIGDWKDQLPEAWRGQVDGIESLEQALDALKRGMDYNPVRDAKDMDAIFKDVEVDAALNAEFRKLAVEHGLTTT